MILMSYDQTWNQVRALIGSMESSYHWSKDPSEDPETPPRATHRGLWERGGRKGDKEHLRFIIRDFQSRLCCQVFEPPHEAPLREADRGREVHFRRGQDTAPRAQAGLDPPASAAPRTSSGIRGKSGKGILYCCTHHFPQRPNV